MSTRSRIAAIDPEGRVRAIYCHSDGYPSHNGRILLEHYRDDAKVQTLLDLGDISSLGPEIGEKQSFDKPNYNMVRAYGRDRGEKDVAASAFNSMEEFPVDWFEEYFYAWKDGKWYWFAGKNLDSAQDLTMDCLVKSNA